MKTVGIIGGLGPETTAKFYLQLIFLCQKLKKTHRPEILICSVPIAYSIEKDVIAKGIGEERCLPLILNAAKKLEKAGADFLVMPCNSLHVYIREIRETVKIPVLSIIEETTHFLQEKNIYGAGIIATTLTLNKKLYVNFFKANGIKQMTPDDNRQTAIDKIVHRLVSNGHSQNDYAQLMEIISDFEAKGIEHVILACTDLQLLGLDHPRINIYDTTQIFAVATVREIVRD